MSILIEHPVLITSMVAYISIVLIAYFNLIEKKRKRRIEVKEKFFKAIFEGMKTNTIETIDDVVNIYKGVAGLSSENLNYRYGLSSQLREFLVDVISKNKKLIDTSLDDSMLLKWKYKISEFIKQNETISPYADLPAAERNILSDVSTFIETNDSDSVKRKILELAGMIQARNDDFNRIQNINKWTVPLSVIGLILTIIFGVLAYTK